MFILKTMDGSIIKITEQQYKNILQAKTDIITLSNGITIRKNVISIIYPESEADNIEKRKSQQIGVLHDGTKVIRHFGNWVLPNRVVFDDSGKDQAVKIDPEYYPEVAADCVATEEEFKKVKSKQDYYQITGYKKPPLRTSINGLTKI